VLEVAELPDDAVLEVADEPEEAVFEVAEVADVAEVAVLDVADEPEEAVFEVAEVADVADVAVLDVAEVAVPEEPDPEAPVIIASQQVVYGADPSLKIQYHWKVYTEPAARLDGILKQPLHSDLSIFSQNLVQFWNPK
jgi:hypothetical protein